MRLFLDIGHSDGSARRGVSEGKTFVVSPELTGSAYGALLACTEGVADAPDRERAAQAAASALREIYETTIDAAPAAQALREALDGANRAVRAGGERGRAAAVAVLLLQGRRWTTAHLGNVRVWRCRDLQLKQLTHDHVTPRAGRRPEVARALGYAESAPVEYREGELKEGDILLLTGSGVHDVLPGATVLGVLQSDTSAQQQAEALVQRALAAGAPGYVGACVARIEKLPPASAAAGDTGLPTVPFPEPDAGLDGYRIERVLIKSRRFRLYRAEDQESGERVFLRFPDPALRGGARAFLREEWIARRLDDSAILKPLAVRPGRRSALYSVAEYRPTENLAKRIRRKGGLPLDETLPLAQQLLGALEALHRAGVVHGEVRANSLLYDKSRRGLCLVGGGTQRRDTRVEESAGLHSNTLSYWAPELFRKSAPTERSDLYAAGVTIYRMLTAKYPYGRIRSAHDWKQARAYAPAHTHKEGIPAEIDEVLARACAVDPQQRYASAAEFAAALGAVRAAPQPAAAAAGAPPAWSWWLAAALTGGLLIYLYSTLR